jgi:hypothetical protein
MNEFSGSKMFGGRDEPEPPVVRVEAPRPKRKFEPEPVTARELLQWMQRSWHKPTISLRDLRNYAPRPARKPEIALNLIETLEKNGWVARTRGHQRNMMVWRTPSGTGL